MANSLKTKFFGKFLYLSPEKPLFFFDTLFWVNMFKDNSLLELVQQACMENKIKILMTNLIKGELMHKRYYDKIIKNKFVEQSIIEIKFGNITANQVLHSLIAFIENEETIRLPFQLCIEQDPLLQQLEPSTDLVNKLANYVKEINKRKSQVDKHDYPPVLLSVEREFWKKHLFLYWMYISISKKVGKRFYDKFFYSYYFMDIPSLAFKIYFFSHVLKSRNIEIQDCVDIWTISELVPYSYLSVIDKDQHNRLLEVKREYNWYFDILTQNVIILSNHKSSPKLVETIEKELKRILND